MVERETILSKLIEKGGLYGSAAQLYRDNAELADAFIEECFDQCHIKSTQDFWGLNLVTEIIEYSIHLKLNRLDKKSGETAIATIQQKGCVNILDSS